MIKQVKALEINQMIETGGECQVIDVREFPEFEADRIHQAKLMPLSNYEAHEAEIDHTKPVYLMCRSGNRARQAANTVSSVTGSISENIIKRNVIFFQSPQSASLSESGCETIAFSFFSKFKMTLGKLLVSTGFGKCA